MNIIAVDDERQALRDLCYELQETQLVSLDDVKTFTSPLKACEYARTNQIDLAFLDIELPGTNGLDLAKNLQETSPDCMIVFLTAYAKYAVDAFQVRAFGYLVKPVTAEAIRQELEAFFKKRGKRKNFFAQCFGRFGFFAQDRPVLFEREKSRELLAYLIDQRGVFITQPELMDVLWEGRTNTPALRSQLRNIIFYLRQSLAAYGAEAVLISRRNELAVDPSAFSCDYYDFLDGVERAVEQFQGEYMLSYSWGEATTATLVALKEHR